MYFSDTSNLSMNSAKKQIFSILNHIEEVIIVSMFALMVIIIFVQVIMRKAGNSLSWSEELARYCFIWLIYIGVAYGCKLMKHIKIDAALHLFPEKVRPYIVITGEVLVLVFAVYIVVTGVELTYKQWEFGKVSPALGLPLQYINAAPVVGFGLVVFRQIQTIWKLVKELPEKGAEKEDGGEA
mgnify:CR=1 FL=1